MSDRKRYAWRVWDPQVGISLWWLRRDARQVAKHRPAICLVERVEVQPGDLVSRLGAPDERIGPAARDERRCAICGGFLSVGMHGRCQ